MANFDATTASNGALVTDAEAARKILQGFHLMMGGGTLTVDGDGRLVLYGRDWLDLVAVPTTLPEDLVSQYRKENGCDPQDWEALWGSAQDLHDWQLENEVPTGMDALAEAIGPLLKDKWVIQSVGSEKCRFPLSAAQWTIHPGGALDVRSLEG